VDRIGDHQRLGAHVRARAHLDVLGVEPQIRIAAFQRALAEDRDMLIQCLAERAHAVLGHAGDAKLLDQAIDLARGDPVDIGLEHDGHDRLLASPARLEEGREVGRASTPPASGDSAAARSVRASGPPCVC